jgi:hypothetical protein
LVEWAISGRRMARPQDLSRCLKTCPEADSPTREVRGRQGISWGAPVHQTPVDYGITALAKEEKKNVRARHETVNKRFKQFGCLHERFRHDAAKHGDVFRAVAVITQLAIENGEPLFGVEHDDRLHYY